MNPRPETSFDSIEGSHEYLTLLQQALGEAQEDIENQITQAIYERAVRREEALRLAAYKLSGLEAHITTSRRLLNDLRTLRRLLFGERRLHMPASEAPSAQTR